MMAKADYYSNGSVIHYKNIGTDPIRYGEVVALTDCLGVAVAEIAPGDTGAIKLDGVFSMPTETAAFTQGQALYWNAADCVVTATAGENKRVGIAVESKEAARTVALVKLG